MLMIQCYFDFKEILLIFEILGHTVYNDTAAIELEQLRLSNVLSLKSICHCFPLMDIRVPNSSYKMFRNFGIGKSQVPQPGKEVA